MTPIAEPLGSAFAPAKINLALHVVGRRSDGYHDLDSLVVFADVGDTIEAFASVGPADTTPLQITGPFGGALAASPGNLVLRAQAALAAAGVALPHLRLRLDKRLPIASGIGGGSADAAATLRLLASLAGRPPSLPELERLGAPLGADVPMCLRSVPLRAEGTGDRLSPWLGVPALPIVLVNPGFAVSTPQVFRRLERRDHPPIGNLPSAFADGQALADWLRRETRNDLEPAAISEAPVIADALAALRATSTCRLARMSGSGATVFGLYDDADNARRAASALAAERPGWWVVATRAAGSP